MATEDFTTYTEVDPDTALTVTTSNIDATNQEGDTDAYVRDSKGANHFGDFEHLVENLLNSSTSNGANCVIWGITDGSSTSAECDTANEGILVTQTNNGGNYTQIACRDYTNDNSDSSLSGLKGLDYHYYLTIERSSTTFTVKIYSDSGRSVLEDTLTITCGTDTYEYIYGYANRGSGGGSTYIYSDVWDLDLQEAEAETHTPSDTAKASDGLVFGVKEPYSDTAKATDSLTPAVKISLNDTAKATDYIFPDHLTLEDSAHATVSVSYSYETLIETPTENINI